LATRGIVPICAATPIGCLTATSITPHSVVSGSDGQCVVDALRFGLRHLDAYENHQDTEYGAQQKLLAHATKSSLVSASDRAKEIAVPNSTLDHVHLRGERSSVKGHERKLKLKKA